MPLSIDPAVATLPQVTLKVVVRSAEGARLTMADVWRPLPSRLTKYLAPGDGVLDLGANVGQLARTFAQAAESSRWVAMLEPVHGSAMIGLMSSGLSIKISKDPAALALGASHGLASPRAETARRQSVLRAVVRLGRPWSVLVEG